jgi:hypothetical protein
MTKPRWIAPSLATATAIFLNLPPLGDGEQGQIQVHPSREVYRPLNGVSDMLVDALAPRPYVIGQSVALFSLMSEVALKLVRDSSSLDGDFARVVDKEFWNLLLK